MKKKLVILTLLVAALVVYLWNAQNMLQMKCHIQHGYFIDKEVGIQFKMPSGTYAVGVWRHSDIPAIRHVDLRWYQGPLYSEYLARVYYEKSSGDPREIISQAMDREVKDALTSENFSNVTIDVKELSGGGNSTKGRLVYSLAQGNFLGGRRVDEVRYMVKDGFLVEVRYSNAKGIYDRLNTQLLDERLDSVFTTFSILTLEDA